LTLSIGKAAAAQLTLIPEDYSSMFLFVVYCLFVCVLGFLCLRLCFLSPSISSLFLTFFSPRLEQEDYFYGFSGYD
jgi:hypothetical protein